ncbi:MAG: valine--tRNA ligase [Balneolaceae bacterium]|nr:valine--tRNA ligase [Balneolaceae bacterium]MBO6546569.1 valine--tRNA ligase [Balneolaceae bacterium]MBO6648928.1 valine--tRNA ligase [Balneolaceae bacterium]
MSKVSQNIPSQYDPSKVEDKWYSYWMEHNYFHSEVDHDKEPFTIVIPPPNVTGVLHMGHMLNNTIQDVLTRRARMQGYNACWVPGTDHASIATEAKVVRKLREEGIKKSDLSRDEFLGHAWEWTHKHGGIILEQLKKLGASCDWDRTSFTMDEKYSESVIDTFIDLYSKGKIYRGERMINWDPAALTALSDEEVIHKEVNSKLYHIRYQIVDSDDFVTIATTRPETILGDTAVCINPNDERYTHLHGKKVIVPLINREVPIILDDYVDMEFGTGCLKVTPAHDVNDYELGQKHSLETINMMNANGTVSEEGELYIGMDRFEVRKQITKDLDEAGNLVKTEDYQNKVGYSERTDVVIEPRLSLQWWVSMKELAQPALENVMNDNIQFHPAKFKNTYRHWMENVKDWCISRQLWWGHRIPAYYYGDGDEDFVVAKTIEEAIELAQKKSGNSSLTQSDLKQDEDVLDTWFSSWLWPISVFDGFYSEEEVDYYYPTNDLVTAPEIMFFWVARMIIAGYEYREELPFKNVYYTGIVRDKLGRKMSKSLGNSPDPLELIAEYGADGVRMGMLFSTPAGNDLPFDPSICDQGKKFSNKIWNAFRFLTMNMEEGVEYKPTTEIDSENLVDRWMMARIHQTIKEVDEDFRKYKLNDALKKVYSLIWDDFCDWYIELAKPDNYGDKFDTQKMNIALGMFEQLMKLLHPFMPFISEEIWQYISDRKPEEALTISDWPEYDSSFDNPSDINLFSTIQEVVSALRNIRAEMGVSPKEELDVFVKTTSSEITKAFSSNQWILTKLQSTKSFKISEAIEKPGACSSAIVNGNEIYVPLEGLIDVDKEIERITSEINRIEGWLKGINGKLINENFVNNAPEAVVQNERNKKRDGEANLAKLREQLKDFE